jgi:hypothetical protein
VQFVIKKTTSHVAATEQCVSMTAGAFKPGRRRRPHVNTVKQAAARALVGRNGAAIPHPPGPGAAEEMMASAEKKTFISKPVVPPSSKPSKAPRQRSQPSRTASKNEKLVCRYCGSDDLAPSFKKRRDARCRACFKKRYGSAALGKQASPAAKTKAAK